MATVNVERHAWKSLEADGRYGRVVVISDTVYLDPDTGGVLKRKRHRRPIEPDADISGEPAVIKAVCNAIRTDDALARWAESQEDQEV